MIAPFIYQDVYNIALSMVEASENADKLNQWAAYNQLKGLCEKHQDTSYDHPFQWETLADFTNDPYASIGIYQKAFRLAKQQHLSDYLASTQLAMAENYLELGELDKAKTNADRANEVAKELPNLVLRREISLFLLTLSKVEKELALSTITRRTQLSLND